MTHTQCQQISLISKFWSFSKVHLASTTKTNEPVSDLLAAASSYHDTS